MSDFRTEHDTMGPVKVPAEALYGAETQRAVQNFPISWMRFGRAFLSALGLVKVAAARANREAGTLPAPIASAIETAAQSRSFLSEDGRARAPLAMDLSFR
jgi:fumarate hydratase class II